MPKLKNKLNTCQRTQKAELLEFSYIEYRDSILKVQCTYCTVQCCTYVFSISILHIRKLSHIIEHRATLVIGSSCRTAIKFTLMFKQLAAAARKKTVAENSVWANKALYIYHH